MRLESDNNHVKSIDKLSKTNKKRFKIFLNGNPTFKGQDISFDLIDHKSFDELLSFISSSIQTSKENRPNIRQLFTPRGFHRVKRTKDIINGNFYVCAGTELFKPIKYPFNSEEDLSTREFKYFLRYEKDKGIWKLNDTSSLTVPSSKIDRLIIVIRKNGEKLSLIKYVLKRKDSATLGQVYADISIAFGPKWSFDRIRTLYHLHGLEVRSLQELFNNDSVFIAIGNSPRIKQDKDTFNLSKGSTFIPTGTEIKEAFSKNRIRCDDVSRVTRIWNNRILRRNQTPVGVNNRRRSALQEQTPPMPTADPYENNDNEIINPQVIAIDSRQRKSRHSKASPEDIEADSGFDEYSNLKSQMQSNTSMNSPTSNHDDGLSPTSLHQVSQNTSTGPATGLPSSSDISPPPPPQEDNTGPCQRRRSNFRLSPIKSSIRLYKNKSSLDKVFETNYVKFPNEMLAKGTVALEAKPSVSSDAELVPMVSRDPNQILHRRRHKQKQAEVIKPTSKSRNDDVDYNIAGRHQQKRGNNVVQNRPQMPNGRRCFVKNYLSSDEISLRYELKRKLGDGNFAVVKQGYNRISGREVAIKTITKDKLTNKESMLSNEINIMRRCKHTNIIKIYDAFETDDDIWIEMELVNGGDLFDSITESVRFPEELSSKMIRDVSRALFYLHCRSIVHRDLKPENLLVAKHRNGNISIKLADFGLAIELKRPLFTICGTPTYIAPEILNEIGYGMPVDLWALGIIAYILLCGFPPFRSPKRRQTELFSKIKSGKFEFSKPYWNSISKEGKDLIRCLLVVDQTRRYKAIDVLTHPWTFNPLDKASNGGDSGQAFNDTRTVEEYLRQHRKALELEQQWI